MIAVDGKERLFATHWWRDSTLQQLASVYIRISAIHSLNTATKSRTMDSFLQFTQFYRAVVLSGYQEILQIQKNEMFKIDRNIDDWAIFG
ncbi:MAG: hypothetical protein CMI18_02590 [Opitutaceae bacterium]|nr:hypothetical protein [Opitutaceae bacterium]|tara:strand:+ start:649 stop:918 length:270 start_codon:yes stop_codon:yes gene_type:complete